MTQVNSPKSRRISWRRQVAGDKLAETRDQRELRDLTSDETADFAWIKEELRVMRLGDEFRAYQGWGELQEALVRIVFSVLRYVLLWMSRQQ